MNTVLLTNNTTTAVVLPSSNGTLVLGSTNVGTGMYVGGIYLPADNGGQGLTIGNGPSTFLTAGPMTAPAVPGEIVIAINGNDTKNEAEVLSTIEDNLSGGKVSVLYPGSGSLYIYTTNFYSGGTYVVSGRVQGNNNQAFGTGPIYVASGSAEVEFNGTGLQITNNFFLSPGCAYTGSSSEGAVRFGNTGGIVTNYGNFTLMGNPIVPGSSVGTTFATIGDRIDGNGATITYNGQFTGSGTLEFYSNNGGATHRLGNTGAANNWTGGMIVDGGSGDGNVVRLLASSQLADNNVTLIANGSAVNQLDMGGFNDTIGGLSSAVSAYLYVTNSQANTPLSTSTLTLGYGNATASFGGKITDGISTANKLNIVKIGNGTQTFCGTNNYVGTTALNGGILNVGSSTALGNGTGAGNITFGGGTLQYSATNQVDYSGRFSTAASQPISIDINGQAVTYATALAGSGTTLTLANSGSGGTLTLNALETYTGATTISGGTLTIGSSGNLTAGSYSANIANNGALNYVGSTSQTLSGNITGSGSLTNAGSYTLTLSGGSGNTYSGSTTIGSSATITLGAANSIPSGSSVSVAGTLNLAGYSDAFDGFSGGGTVNGSSGTPTLTIGSNNHGGTFSGVIANAGGTVTLTKSGSATEILGGASTFTGGVNINGGILQVAGTETVGTSGPLGKSGTIAFGGGTLQYSSADKADYSGRFSTAASQAINVDVNGQSVAWATALTSSGGTLTLSDTAGGGILTLGGANTYSGATTVNGGTLVVNSSSTGTSLITLNAGALGGSGTISGGVTLASGAKLSLTNAHPLTISGTLTLNGNNTVLVNSGSLLSGGTITLLTATGGITGAGNLNLAPTIVGGVLPSGDIALIAVSGNSIVLNVTQVTVGDWTDAHSTTDNNWEDALNWSSTPSGYPTVAGDTATFGSGGVGTPVNLTLPEAVGTLNFTNASSYTISTANSSILTLDNKGVGAAVSVTGGSINTISTAVSLKDNATVTVAGADKLTFGGVVANAPSVTKTLTLAGAGTNALAAANTYGPVAGTVGTTVNSSGTVQLGNNTALSTGDVSITGNPTLQAAPSTTLTVANNFAIASSQTATVDNNGTTFTLDGIISGSGALAAKGSGQVTLSGANTFSGNLTVNSGTVGFASDGYTFGTGYPLGVYPSSVTAGAVTLNGATAVLLATSSATISTNRGITVGANGGALDAASGQTLTVSSVISGSGGLTKGGAAGTVVLTTTNAFTGFTTITAGTLQLNNGMALTNSTLKLGGGTLAFGPGITNAILTWITNSTGSQNLALQTVDTTPLPVTLTISNLYNVTDTNQVNITGPGSLVIAGGGVLTFTNLNNTGSVTDTTTTVSSTISGGSFGSSTSSLIVGTAGTLILSGTASATEGSAQVAPVGGETGGSLNISGGASASFASTTIGAIGNTGGHLTVNTTGTVSLGALIDYKDNQGAMSTSRGLIINNGAVTASSVILQYAGNGANLNITGGSLTIGNSSSVGDFIVGDYNSANGNGAYLSMTGGALTYLGTDGLLAGDSVGTFAALAISGGTVNLTGITLEPVTAAYNSTLTLSGGATLYLGGVGLVIGSGDTASPAISLGTSTVGALANWVSSAPITLSSGGNTTFQPANAGGTAFTNTLNGVVAGSGALTVNGAGTLILGGADTYTGNTTVTAGTLLVNGSTAAASAVTVAAGATLGGTGTINGSVNWSSGGLASLTLTPVAGVNTTPLTAGVVTLNGNTVTINVPGSQPLGYGTYTLMNYTAAGSSGTFATIPTYTGAGAAARTTSTITTSGGVVTLVVQTSAPKNIWTDTDGNGNWSDVNNWSTGYAPSVAGDYANLGVGSGSVTLNTAESMGLLTFTNTTIAYTISGANTLTLDNSGEGALVSVSTGGSPESEVIGTPVSLNDNASISVASGDTLTLNGVISGTSPTLTLGLSGPGTSILNNANTYGPSAGAVGTYLAGGMLQVGNNTALGAGDVSVAASSTLQAGAAGLSVGNNLVTASGVTLTANDNGNLFTLGGNISGSAALLKLGGGTLTLSGTSTYSGATTISAGGLTIGGLLSSTGTAGTYAGAITDNGSFIINSSAAETLSGVISGSGTLTQSGSGTTTLTATESFTGATTVSSGILALNAGNHGTSGLYASSGLTINGGTVQVITDNSLAGSTTALGTLPVTINAGGVLEGVSTADAGGGTSSHIRGVLTLAGGTLAGSGGTGNANYGFWDLDDGVVVSGGTTTSTISSPEVLPSQSGGTTFNVANVTSGGIDLNVTGTLITGNLLADTGIIKTGNGVMALSGLNTYTGATIISAGTLSVGANAPSGSAGALGNATSAITLGNAATASGNTSPALLIGGPFTVGRAVTVAAEATSGTYTIGGSTDANATFSGALTINEPLTIYQATNNGGNGLTLSGGISAGSAGTETLTFAGPGSVKVTTTGVANGSGTVAVTVSGGTNTFSAANTYTGNTTISAGTLALSGSGSIANTPNIIVAGGAVFDVSGLTAAFALGSSQTLSNSASTAVIRGSASTGSGKISLTYASGTPALTVTNGTLMLSGSTAFIVNNTGSALPAGLYELISTNADEAGPAAAITGTLPPVTVTGGGLVSGATATLNLVNGELYLLVDTLAAEPMTVTRTAGLSLLIALSDVEANWTSAALYPASLAGINLVSTNGVNLVTNSAWILYPNSPNVNDQISYTISDSLGSTKTGLINIVIQASVTGTNSITGITTGGTNVVSAYGIPGYNYILERSTNLAPAVWIDVSTNTAATNGLIHAVDTFWDLGGVPAPSAFYQLKWQP